MRDEELSEGEFATKLFEQLDTLEHRYRRFMRRATLALAILIATTLWQVFFVLPDKSNQIARLANPSDQEIVQRLERGVDVMTPEQARRIIGQMLAKGRPPQHSK
jgi:hypothetical protein